MIKNRQLWEFFYNKSSLLPFLNILSPLNKVDEFYFGNKCLKEKNVEFLAFLFKKYHTFKNLISLKDFILNNDLTKNSNQVALLIKKTSIINDIDLLNIISEIDNSNYIWLVWIFDNFKINLNKDVLTSIFKLSDFNCNEVFSFIIKNQSNFLNEEIISLILHEVVVSGNDGAFDVLVSNKLINEQLLEQSIEYNKISWINKILLNNPALIFHTKDNKNIIELAKSHSSTSECYHWLLGRCSGYF